MKRLYVMGLVVLMIFSSACGSSDGGGESESPHSANTVTLVEANNQLAFDLLDSFSTEQENDNVFFSPVSLYIALSLAFNGADGETKEEMSQILKINDLDILNHTNRKLFQNLVSEKAGIDLHLANSLWLNDAFHFKSEFKGSMSEYYEAEISRVDVTDSRTPGQINDWVESQTNGKIQDMVEGPLDPNTVAFLINAIYLKADWMHAFHPNLTEIGTFYLSDGSVKDMEMMALTEELDYLETEEFQAVVLPYGEGDMSMQIFLPQGGLEDFEKEFTLDDWLEWQDDFSAKEGSVLLPAFEMEFEASFNDLLRSLGMETAFQTRQADFTRLVEEPDDIYISEVKQKTYLLVDEEGTEAAGATSVEMRIESAPIEEPFRMEVNRPFFIIIKDENTDAILFHGKIADPPARK